MDISFPVASTRSHTTALDVTHFSIMYRGRPRGFVESSPNVLAQDAKH